MIGTTMWHGKPDRELDRRRKRAVLVLNQNTRNCGWTKRFLAGLLKYGFKHAKPIVRIRFVEKQPLNSWLPAANDSMASTPTESFRRRLMRMQAFRPLSVEAIARQWR